MEEQKLIQKAQQGDDHALSMLLQQNYTFLLKYLVKITLQPSLAEDLVQETMLKCIQKIHQYNGKSKFSSWLITIASNLYIDTMRRTKREQHWRAQEQSIRLMKWQADYSHADWSDMLDALSHLSYEIRFPVIMKHYYGYTQEEIGDMMNVPVGTIKSRIYNGLKSLRRELTIDE